MPAAVRAVVGGHEIGDGRPLLLIAGPCVLESEAQALAHARKVKALAERHRVPAVFKASFDKANRTSAKSFRGVGLEAGLAIFEKVKRETGLACLTDVHEAWQAEPVGRVVDGLGRPAVRGAARARRRRGGRRRALRRGPRGPGAGEERRAELARLRHGRPRDRRRARHPPRARAAVTPDLLARAARVRLLLLDVDGVLTDGRLY